MRDILFRGKRIDNGEWVYGYLYITHSGEYEIGSYDKKLNIERLTSVVVPESVGQYTGLKDKSGKKIFEGDICEVTLFDCFGVDRQEIVDVINEYGCFWLESDSILMVFDEVGDFESDVEVIGNTYDNPELIRSDAE